MTLKVKVAYGLIADVVAFQNAFEDAIKWIDSQHKHYTFKTTYQATDDRMYAFIEYAPQPDPLPSKPPEEY